MAYWKDDVELISKEDALNLNEVEDRNYSVSSIE